MVVVAATEELVVMVELPAVVADADEDELVEEIPAHLEYAEFPALEMNDLELAHSIIVLSDAGVRVGPISRENGRLRPALLKCPLTCRYVEAWLTWIIKNETVLTSINECVVG